MIYLNSRYVSTTDKQKVMNTLHIFILLSLKNPQKMIKQVHIVTFARIGITTHNLQIYVSLPDRD